MECKCGPCQKLREGTMRLGDAEGSISAEVTGYGFLTAREKWLMRRAFVCGFGNGGAPTIVPYTFADWIIAEVADGGVTVEMMLSKECPYLP